MKSLKNKNKKKVLISLSEWQVHSKILIGFWLKIIIIIITLDNNNSRSNNNINKESLIMIY